MTAFNGRLVSALSPDRVYRVRIELGEVHFVQVGGRDPAGHRPAIRALGSLDLRTAETKVRGPAQGENPGRRRTADGLAACRGRARHSRRRFGDRKFGARARLRVRRIRSPLRTLDPAAARAKAHDVAAGERSRHAMRAGGDPSRRSPAPQPRRMGCGPEEVHQDHLTTVHLPAVPWPCTRAYPTAPPSREQPPQHPRVQSP